MGSMVRGCCMMIDGVVGQERFACFAALRSDQPLGLSAK